MSLRVFTDTQDVALDALIASADALDGAEVGLITNVPDLTDPLLVTGDLVEPGFTGYLRVTPAAWAKGTDTNGSRKAAAPPVEFVGTVEGDFPVTVRGAFIANAAGDLVVAGMFAAPKTIQHAGQTLHVTPQVPMDGQPAQTLEAGLT